MTDIRDKKSVLSKSALIAVSLLLLLFSACRPVKKITGIRYTGGFTDYGALVFSYKDPVASSKVEADIQLGKRFFQNSIDSFNTANGTRHRIGFIVDTLVITRPEGDKIYYRVRAVFEPVPVPLRPRNRRNERSNLSDSSGTTPPRPCGPRPGSKVEIIGVDFAETYSNCDEY